MTPQTLAPGDALRAAAIVWRAYLLKNPTGLALVLTTLVFWTVTTALFLHLPLRIVLVGMLATGAVDVATFFVVLVISLFQSANRAHAWWIPPRSGWPGAVIVIKPVPTNRLKITALAAWPTHAGAGRVMLEHVARLVVRDRTTAEFQALPAAARTYTAYGAPALRTHFLLLTSFELTPEAAQAALRAL